MVSDFSGTLFSHKDFETLSQIINDYISRSSGNLWQILRLVIYFHLIKSKVRRATEIKSKTIHDLLALHTLIAIINHFYQIDLFIIAIAIDKQTIKVIAAFFLD